MFKAIAEELRRRDAERSTRASELTEKYAPEDLTGQREEIARLLSEGLIGADIASAAMEDINKRDPLAQFMDGLVKAGDDALKAATARATSITESGLTPWEKAQRDMEEAKGLNAQGLLSDEALGRAIAAGMENSPMAQMEQERLAWMKEAMKEVPQDAVERSVDALSGGDVAGQVMRGALGGAQNLQQEQLNAQKRMERWLSIIAGGGAQQPMMAWGR
jgi:hypothetical protein